MGTLLHVIMVSHLRTVYVPCLTACILVVHIVVSASRWNCSLDLPAVNGLPSVSMSSWLQTGLFQFRLMAVSRSSYRSLVVSRLAPSFPAREIRNDAGYSFSQTFCQYKLLNFGLQYSNTSAVVLYSLLPVSHVPIHTYITHIYYTPIHMILDDGHNNTLMDTHAHSHNTSTPIHGHTHSHAPTHMYTQTHSHSLVRTHTPRTYTHAHIRTHIPAHTYTEPCKLRPSVIEVVLKNRAVMVRKVPRRHVEAPLQGWEWNIHWISMIHDSSRLTSVFWICDPL